MNRRIAQTHPVRYDHAATTHDQRRRYRAAVSPAQRRRHKTELPTGSRRALVAAAVLATLAAPLVFLGAAFEHVAGGTRPTKESASTESPAQSTPAAEWRVGSMPNLYQTDPAWACAPYAGSTVREAGCGPTCLTMVYVYLTGKTDYDPATMSVFSERNGFVDQGMSSWLLMSEGARMLGLTAEELPASADMVADTLAAGLPIICSMGPGDFTSSGHFIVLCGLGEDGGAAVFDPNSAERSSRTWSIDTILAQCRNLWAYSS